MNTSSSHLLVICALFSPSNPCAPRRFRVWYFIGKRAMSRCWLLVTLVVWMLLLFLAESFFLSLFYLPNHPKVAHQGFNQSCWRSPPSFHFHVYLCFSLWRKKTFISRFFLILCTSLSLLLWFRVVFSYFRRTLMFFLDFNSCLTWSVFSEWTIPRQFLIRKMSVEVDWDIDLLHNHLPTNWGM